MANTSGEKELKTDYPFTSGLIAGTTSQLGHKETLEPEKSFVEERLRKGL